MPQTPGFFIWIGGAELAEAVISARHAMGLTQVELGRRAGVGRRFMWQLEHGKPTLRADKVLAVLRVLELVPVLLPAAVAGMLNP